MSDAYEVAHLDELEALPVPGASARLAIRERFAVGAFGVNAYRAAEAGKQVIEEHDELGPSAAGHEELYLVLSGRATFTVAGEEVDAPTGTVLFAQPEIRRGAVAREPGTTVLVLGGSRGQP